MANRNFANSRIYTGHVMPVLLDCNFVVDSTNGNGLGIRSLKGPYVQNVFMHTSASPGAGNSNPATPGLPVINPNPASGTIVIQLQDNYNRAYTGGFSIVSPPGSSTASPSAGEPVLITSLGSSTQAQFVASGMPSSLLPAIGLAFIANGTAIAGGGMVAPSATAGSGVLSIEVLGDSNQSLAPQKGPQQFQGFGGQIILQCRGNSDDIVTPADGSVISLSLLLSNSSILIDGE